MLVTPLFIKLSQVILALLLFFLLFCSRSSLSLMSLSYITLFNISSLGMPFTPMSAPTIELTMEQLVATLPPRLITWFIESA